MHDLISVIVPIYRVEQYLEKCIQSIRNQTYENLEIILVDDGSDDRCPQICDKYACIDKRVKVIHKENGGPDSARKAGISVAKGKYIGYVDGDDWIESVMYEKLIEYACMYEVDIVESGVIDSWSKVEYKRSPYLAEGCYKDGIFIEKVESKLLYAGIFFEYGISPYLWSKLFLKEKIEKYQMIEDMTNAMYDDVMLALPCIAESKKVYISHECYYHYTVRNNSLKRAINLEEIKKIFDCYPEFYVRFKGTKLSFENDKQIQYFVMYWLLLNVPYIFDNPDSNMILIPFGGIERNNKIILYGAGAAGIHLKNYIQSIEGCNIVCWADRNYESLQCMLNVRNPKEIVNYNYDYVIISILRENTVQSAKKDLIAIGVPKNKILWIEQKYIENPELLLSKVVYQGKKLI